MIPGEGPSAGIGAVHTRCQADNTAAGSRIAKGGYRPGEVIGIRAANPGQKAGKALALNAIGAECGHAQILLITLNI